MSVYGISSMNAIILWEIKFARMYQYQFLFKTCIISRFYFIVKVQYLQKQVKLYSLLQISRLSVCHRNFKRQIALLSKVEESNN